MKPEDMESPIKQLILLDSNAYTFSYKLFLTKTEELLVHYVLRGEYRNKGMYAFAGIEVREKE